MQINSKLITNKTHLEIETNAKWGLILVGLALIFWSLNITEFIPTDLASFWTNDNIQGAYISVFSSILNFADL
ncbi:MAG: hypothetical protein IIC67_07245 [Thaumarchaeota archaeon]|nr:hypothetical protein [Nitrososphaerota archaeon]